MSIYAMPIILMIEADSFEEAKKSLVDWTDETELEDMPDGTRDIHYDLDIEQDDEGHRCLQLPAHEEYDDEELETIDDNDDFNDGDDL